MDLQEMFQQILDGQQEIRESIKEIKEDQQEIKERLGKIETRLDRIEQQQNDEVKVLYADVRKIKQIFNPKVLEAVE